MGGLVYSKLTTTTSEHKMIRCFLIHLYVILTLLTVCIEGSFIGDFPDKDPKQSCNVVEDCTNENETCHFMEQFGGFCGTEKCETENDCLDIGHIVYGIFNAKGCNNGLCEYWQGMLIA